MKNMLLSFLLLYLFTITPFFSDSGSEERAGNLCNCLKNAMKTKKAKDKKACLILREKHVKEIGKGSENYTDYINRLSECEKELIAGDMPAKTSSYEEKVSSVCDCFKNTDKNSKFKCFQLQSELGKLLESDLEKKKTFTNETNSCDK